MLGGSGGARALNEAVMRVAPALLDRFPQWELLHQTGARDFPGLERQPRHGRHRLQAFIEGMDLELEASSLVISRSGASTCAEAEGLRPGGDPRAPCPAAPGTTRP